MSLQTIFSIQSNGLNNCDKIKSLYISGSKDFKIPILPSLIKLKLVGGIGKIDLRNLIYSLSLKKVSVIDHGGKPIPIPKQLKERGVILDSSSSSSFIEFDYVDESAFDDSDDDDNDDKNYDDGWDNDFSL